MGNPVMGIPRRPHATGNPKHTRLVREKPTSTGTLKRTLPHAQYGRSVRVCPGARKMSRTSRAHTAVPGVHATTSRDTSMGRVYAHHGPLDGHRQSLGPGQQPVGGSSSLGSGRRAGGGYCPHRQHRHLLNATYSWLRRQLCTYIPILHCKFSSILLNTLLQA